MALAPLLAIFGSLYLLDQRKKEAASKGAVGRPPLWTPDAVTAVADVWHNGIRSIKEDILPAVVDSLHAFSLEGVAVPPGAPGSLLKLIPKAEGAVSAHAFAEDARRHGALVLVSLTCALVGGADEKLFFVTRPEHRGLAGPLGQFALLWRDRVIETEIAEMAEAAKNVTETPKEEPACADADAAAPRPDVVEAPSEEIGLASDVGSVVADKSEANGIAKHAEPELAVQEEIAP